MAGIESIILAGSGFQGTPLRRRHCLSRGRWPSLQVTAAPI